MTPAIALLLLLAGQMGPPAPALSNPQLRQADKAAAASALEALSDPLAGIPHTRIPSPADAAVAAASDLSSLLPGDQPWQRYIWITKPTRTKVAAVIYGLNTLSSSSVDYTPAILEGGALIRVDLRRLAPLGGDVLRIRDIWEEFAVTNAYFNTIRSAVKQVETVVPGALVDKRVQVRNSYGQLVWQNQKVPGPNVKKLVDQKVTVSEFSIHTNLQNMLLLHVLSGESRAPLVRYDQFMITSLTTIDGGKYYDWKNIRKSPDPKLTDLEFFLKDHLGVDQDEIDRLRADQRIAMFASGVTSRPRRVCFFNSSAVRPTVGAGLVTITDDFKRGSIEAKQHPVKSLASKKADAHELIAMQKNGFLLMSIFNGKGELAFEVPSEIAYDTTIPTPFDQTLQPGISCLSCHAGGEGWLPARNDVQRLHKQLFLDDYTPTQLRVFDDEQSNEDVLETLDRLHGQFDGDTERTAFRQARNDHQRAVFHSTGGVGSKEAMQGLREIRNNYLFTYVTPRMICEEMGYQVADDATAVLLFNRLVPLTPANKFGVRTEDPVIASFRAYDLLEPIPVNRQEIEPIYSDIMLRVKTGQAANALLNKGKIP